MAERYANVFITGASSGLGRGLAGWFARRGARVYAAARRKELLASLRAELAGAQGSIEPVSLDVSKAAATVERLLALDAECGGMDLVIANAGVGGATDARKLAWPTFQAMLEVNIVGAAATLTALAPAMAARGRGHLVGVSSLAAFILPPKRWGYSATKSFVHQMCQGLRIDLAGTGVKVTCIYPGFVKTELTAKNRFKMPFLLELDDAVERMGKAIVAERTDFAFPWQTSALARATRFVPRHLQVRVGKRVQRDAR